MTNLESVRQDIEMITDMMEEILTENGTLKQKTYDNLKETYKKLAKHKKDARDSESIDCLGALLASAKVIPKIKENEDALLNGEEEYVFKNS